MAVFNIIAEVSQLRSYEVEAEDHSDAVAIVSDDWKMIPFEEIDTELDSVNYYE